MYVTSSGIVDGVIERKYGKFGDCFYKGKPSYSLPFAICDIPRGTKAFAVTLIDYDTIPRIGFAYIHWLLVNVPRSCLGENESSNNPYLIQGVSSAASPYVTNPLTKEEASRYIGMAPPDRPHVYTLTVYAQSCFLPLQKGFYLNELYRELAGNTLASATVEGVYFARDYWENE